MRGTRRQIEPMNSTKNYYSVMEIHDFASTSDAKRAYHRLALRWHPDRQVHAPEHAQREAEDNFKRINEAYAVLSDKVRRKEYDVVLRGALLGVDRGPTRQRQERSSGATSEGSNVTKAASQAHENVAEARLVICPGCGLGAEAAAGKKGGPSLECRGCDESFHEVYCASCKDWGATRGRRGESTMRCGCGNIFCQSRCPSCYRWNTFNGDAQGGKTRSCGYCGDKFHEAFCASCSGWGVWKGPKGCRSLLCDCGGLFYEIACQQCGMWGSVRGRHAETNNPLCCGTCGCESHEAFCPSCKQWDSFPGAKGQSTLTCRSPRCRGGKDGRGTRRNNGTRENGTIFFQVFCECCSSWRSVLGEKTAVGTAHVRCEGCKRDLHGTSCPACGNWDQDSNFSQPQERRRRPRAASTARRRRKGHGQEMVNPLPRCTSCGHRPPHDEEVAQLNCGDIAVVETSTPTEAALPVQNAPSPSIDDNALTSARVREAEAGPCLRTRRVLQAEGADSNQQVENEPSLDLGVAQENGLERCKQEVPSTPSRGNECAVSRSSTCVPQAMEEEEYEKIKGLLTVPAIAPAHGSGAHTQAHPPSVKAYGVDGVVGPLDNPSTIDRAAGVVKRAVSTDENTDCSSSRRDGGGHKRVGGGRGQAGGGQAGVGNICAASSPDGVKQEKSGTQAPFRLAPPSHSSRRRIRRRSADRSQEHRLAAAEGTERTPLPVPSADVLGDVIKEGSIIQPEGSHVCDTFEAARDIQGQDGNGVGDFDGGGDSDNTVMQCTSGRAWQGPGDYGCCANRQEQPHKEDQKSRGSITASAVSENQETLVRAVSRTMSVGRTLSAIPREDSPPPPPGVRVGVIDKRNGSHASRQHGESQGAAGKAENTSNNGSEGPTPSSATLEHAKRRAGVQKRASKSALGGNKGQHVVHLAFCSRCQEYQSWRAPVRDRRRRNASNASVVGNRCCGECGDQFCNVSYYPSR